MLIEVLPFSIKVDATTLAGIALWSLALYLGFFPVSEWVMDRLTQWMSGGRRASESQSAFSASLLSIVPFLVAGGLCNWGIAVSLGRSWTISMGIIACIGCGVYELGRRDGRSLE